MNKRKTYALTYFLGRAFFLGFGYSLLLSTTSSDTWICFFLGTIIGMIFIYAISKIKEKMQDRTLKEYLDQNKIFKYIFLCLFFFFNLFILSQILFILETFAASFFLIKSPPYFILLPVVLLIYRITKKGWHTIGRISEILMPISLAIVIITSLLLVSYGKLDNFLPILTSNTKSLFCNTLFFAFYSSAPFLILLDAPIKDTKLIRKYLLSTTTIIIMGLLIITVLGPNLIQIYRYPEYMILKKIRVFEFLEKIENIISFSWIVDLFMILAMSGNNIRSILPKKKNKIVFASILFLLFICVIILGKAYHIELAIYHILPIILGCFEIILLLILIIYQIFYKKKNSNT